jgi:hypothetical protein
MWGESYEIPTRELHLNLNNNLCVGSSLHIPADRLSSEFLSPPVFSESYISWALTVF